jgi:1,4-alpha-glucan branching enzyme
LEHLIELDGVKGVYFCRFKAPTHSVSIVGDFNFWTQGEHLLQGKGWDSSCSTSGRFIPNIRKGTLPL